MSFQSIDDLQYENSKEKGLIIHVSATKFRLLELADEIRFTKPTENGMRNFNIGCLDDFLFDSMYINIFHIKIRTRTFFINHSEMQAE